MMGFEIPVELQKQLYTDNWPVRRRWLRLGMLGLWVNAEWVLYGIMTGTTPDAMKVEVLMTLIGAILSIFFAFVFGAVWDDNNKRHHVTEMAKDTTQTDDNSTVVKQ